jgi:lipoate---protein ligase
MKLDRWLFEQHCAGLHPPTLRFYTWSPVAISLGYHQHHYPSAWQDLSWQGQPVELVRRPTGGRAVLHHHDLTYAVITSISGDRMQAYQTICEFLLAGWRSLNLPLHYGEAKRGYIHNANCFGTATAADLVLENGAKFIGSAQLRRGDAVLQHGSMRLDPNPELFKQVFGVEMEAIDLPLIAAGQTMTQVMERAIAALTEAASHCFDAQFLLQPLSDEEWQAVMAQEELSLAKK